MEILGLLFDIFVFFAVAVFVSASYLAFAWLALRRHPYRRTKLLLYAGLLPPCCAVYVLVASLALSITGADLLFGDIDVGLPNGDRLVAMGKMHHNANITGTPQSVGWVAGIAVEASTVYGAYSHDFSDAPHASYFALDTRTGIYRNFNSVAELNSCAGHSITLVDPEDYQSADPTFLRDKRIENSIRFVPPLILLLFCPIYLLRVRRGAASDQANA